MTITRILIFCGLLIFSPWLYAVEGDTDETALLGETLQSLADFLKLQASLQEDIARIRESQKAAESEAEKQVLTEQLEKLQADLRTTRKNFEEIAAGTNLGNLRTLEQQKFNFQEEILSLIEPVVKELKDMTSDVRKKSELREAIARYSEKLPLAEKAIESLSKLIDSTESEAVRARLQELLRDWEQQRSFIKSELQAAQLQLDKLESSEKSFTESSSSYLKSFFQKRGRYLLQALLVVVVILVVSRLIYKAMTRLIPDYRKEHRSFRTRLLDLFHRILTLLLVISGPMVVFYVVEDWVLFSISLLVLIGLAWTLRQTLPRYWKQMQLFLNIGSVREGERIFLDGLPWKIAEINFYSKLENPIARLVQRVPLDDLVDLKSRPLARGEPWFPCKKDDWIIMADGTRGKVIGISQELVTLVQRGGAQRTYTMEDFLGGSPLNLATNFRIKEVFGITYNLQAQSTQEIPALLEAHVAKRIEEEGYAEKLLNLRVEFAQANTSSLDIVVIADFRGELGDLYNRLRRAIQRWCVEAATDHGWEIPFQQITLHHAGES
jgi:hypothetical protein